MATTWQDYLDEKSLPFEARFLGEKFIDRSLLIRALTRHAVLNEKLEHEEMKTNGSQVGLDTIGDKVLDFVIIDHFAQKARTFKGVTCTPEKLNHYREIYGKNLNLYKFSRYEMELQEYVIWGPDEDKTKRWKTSRKMLADCFEACIGAIYLDGGIERTRRFIREIRFFEKMDKIIKK